LAGSAFPTSPVPQSSQNADEGEFSAPQFEQRRESGLPQAPQNFLPVVLSVPHFVQRIDSLGEQTAHASYTPNV